MKEWRGKVSVRIHHLCRGRTEEGLRTKALAAHFLRLGELGLKQ
jgi:hypothetical protein